MSSYNTSMVNECHNKFTTLAVVGSIFLLNFSTRASEVIYDNGNSIITTVMKTPDNTQIHDSLIVPSTILLANATTRDAIEELEAGKGSSFNSIEELMDDLRADN